VRGGGAYIAALMGTGKQDGYREKVVNIDDTGKPGAKRDL